MVNLLLRWNAGGWTTYNPNNADGYGPSLNIPNTPSNIIQNNVQYVDYYDASLRVSKSVKINRVNVQLFADISNLFNTKYLNSNLTGDKDYRLSLHLPQSQAYNNIPGSDKLGDYRNPDVDWQPEENGVDLNSVPSRYTRLVL